MSKSALVIAKTDLELPIEEWKPFMMSRDICETDENYLQLIPYIAVVNERGEYFSYERGSAGNEARLHAKRSIGLGGHIDHPVTTTIEDLIATEAARELEEEVGLIIGKEEILAALEDAIIIHETDTAVDRVHLGIAFEIYVHTNDLTKLEDGVVINPKWMSARAIETHWALKELVKEDALKWEFEKWSDVYLSRRLFAVLEDYTGSAGLNLD